VSPWRTVTNPSAAAPESSGLAPARRLRSSYLSCYGGSALGASPRGSAGLRPSFQKNSFRVGVAFHGSGIIRCPPNSCLSNLVVMTALPILAAVCTDSGPNFSHIYSTYLRFHLQARRFGCLRRDLPLKQAKPVSKRCPDPLAKVYL
jgi:hypothetical protein